MYYHYNNAFMYSPFHFIGSVINFVFWLLVVVFIIKLIKRRKGVHGTHSWHRVWGEKGAVELLRERFAKGEISKEEYEEKLKVLEK